MNSDRPTNKSQEYKDIAKSEQRPEVQTYFYGINTASQPYLLNQHSPYLVNFKFDSSGQTLYRRDGHKIFKDFTGNEKIIAAEQCLDGSIYYITQSGSSITLRSLTRQQSQTIEKSIDISSFVSLAPGDYIDNFDIISGFFNSGTPTTYAIYPYFNIKDSSRNIKSNVNLKTNIGLTTVGLNDAVKVTNPAITSPLNIISHSMHDGSLFALVKDGASYILAWGTKGSITLDKSTVIPNNEDVYAIKSFGNSVFVFAEDRVYRAIMDPQQREVTIEVHSEGYGITSNKLIKGIGSSIYYYGQSSGLSIMTGNVADSISDVNQLQRPIDHYVSNFHKVFRAKKICHKKDDNSIYIIGSTDCDYIARALHWQEVWCKSPTLMSDSEYEQSFNTFKADLDNKDQIILEYNVSLLRFSLHYYKKRVLGHFNMRLRLPGLEYDQSSELIFTEDYIATTHSDFVDDAGTNFPVQFNTIPRNRGLFNGYLSSVYKLHINFTSNSTPIPGQKIYITNTEFDFPITNKGLELAVEDSLEHESTNKVSNVITVSQTVTLRKPSHLIGFESNNILILDGVNIEHNTSSMNNS